MKVCQHAQKYRNGLTRCLRDGGSLRHCNPDKCVHYKPTLRVRFIKWWNNL